MLMSQSIVAQYDFSGNANDLSGNNNHGVVVNATLCEDRFGTPASAYAFDGNSSYITISHYADFNFGEDDFAVSFWMKTNSDSPKGMMFQKGSRSSSQAPQFWIRTNDNINNNAIAFLTSNAVPPSPYAGCDTVYVIDNQWHHIVAQRSQKFLEIHVDCELVATNYDIFRDVNDDIGVIIGAQHPHPGSSSISNYFEGALDDFRIFNEALNYNEVQGLCTEQPLTYNEKNKTNTFKAFPNPTRGKVRFSKTYQSVIVYNNQGVKLRSFNNCASVDLSTLPNGMYIIKADDTVQKIAVYKN